MSQENTFKSGKVAVVGRPNVGKSTLLNALLKHKVAIVSPKPQTTRSQIAAYLEDDRGQIIFLDTPGFYKSRGGAASYNTIISESIREADVILYIVDKSRDWGREDQQVWHQVQNSAKPVILVINKTDIKSPDYIQNYQTLLRNEVDKIILASANRGTNLNQIIDSIIEFLPAGKRDAMVDEFPTPLVSQSSREYAGELIREKIYWHTGQEVPYVTRVQVTDIQTEDDRTKIEADIIVPEKRYKGILIGKNGSKIKQIGTAVRRELEIMTNQKFIIDLMVVVE